MTDQSLSITQTFDRTPEEVFDAVLDVRGWWGKAVDGGTTQVRDEFVYEVPGIHRSRMRLTEVVPHERVVWLAVENTITFVEDQHEWDGTEVVFEISPLDDGRTELRFTHVGLVPDFECYEACHKGWSFYVGQSLRELIETGTGQPNDFPDEVALLGEPRVAQ